MNDYDTNKEIDCVGYNHQTGWRRPLWWIAWKFLGKSFLEEECPFCGGLMTVFHVNTWRNSGAGLTCNLCAHARPGKLVQRHKSEKSATD